MSLLAKQQAKQRRHLRTRKRIQGSAQRPRLSVAVTNQHVIAQLINDQTGQTLAYSSSLGQTQLATKLSDRAAWVGKDIAAKAKTAKIKVVVLDRGSRRYHGRVKVLAAAARQGGLEF
ncbi:50S ribosomal protein L18 [Candidatus Microgenomates bacterium]|nr:50S ribosomal protein L18 [Candidatus Microgenomates bacterium]